MDGNGKRLPFHLGLFITGMSACYAHHIPALNRWVQRPLVNRFLGAFGLVLLALLFLTARQHHEAWLAQLPFFGSLRPTLGWRHPGAFGALGALLIFITLVCEGRLIHRVLASFPLRALGIVSFGLYLVHMVVLDKLKDSGIAPGTELFFLTLAIAYALACVLYGFVERPFIRMGTTGR
jgi:peptidoglycan/LPS O-acetylase OafA/YrhL